MIRSAFQAFESQATPSRMMRGEVVSCDTLADGRTLSLTFTVRPVEAGYTDGTDGGLVSNVILLQAGFGNLGGDQTPPTGLVSVPEVGSRVLCAHDGFRWCIVGCYTGPVTTKAETDSDPNRTRVSFNPGIEHAVPRSSNPGVFDTVSDWGQGLQPGDSLLGKGRSRVKVFDGGALIGGDQNSFTLYKRNGERIDRSAEDDTRRLGYWARHTYGVGTDQRLLESIGPVKNTPGSFVYHCEVRETSLYPDEHAPYIIEQGGHVSPTTFALGRSAVEGRPTPLTVSRERLGDDYVVSRFAVIEPLVGGMPTKVDVEDTAQVTHYDRRVKPDGSFVVSAGNIGRMPGADAAPDFRLEYDARSGEFSLRVGAAGAPAATVTIKGRAPTDGKITATAANAELTVLQSAKVTAGQSIEAKATRVSVQATQIQAQAGGTMLTLSPAECSIVAPVINLIGPLNVAGPIVQTQPVPVSLGSHTHSYVDTPVGPAVTAPPNPG